MPCNTILLYCIVLSVSVCLYLYVSSSLSFSLSLSIRVCNTVCQCLCLFVYFPCSLSCLLLVWLSVSLHFVLFYIECYPKYTIGLLHMTLFRYACSIA